MYSLGNHLNTPIKLDATASIVPLHDMQGKKTAANG